MKRQLGAVRQVSRIPFLTHSSLCLPSAWAGWAATQNPWAVAERIQFWASCCLYELHDLEQVVPHASQASAASSKMSRMAKPWQAWLALHCCALGRHRQSIAALFPCRVLPLTLASVQGSGQAA